MTLVVYILLMTFWNLYVLHSWYDIFKLNIAGRSCIFLSYAIWTQMISVTFRNPPPDITYKGQPTILSSRMISS